MPALFAVPVSEISRNFLTPLLLCRSFRHRFDFDLDSDSATEAVALAAIALPAGPRRAFKSTRRPHARDVHSRARRLVY